MLLPRLKASAPEGQSASARSTSIWIAPRQCAIRGFCSFSDALRALENAVWRGGQPRTWRPTSLCQHLCINPSAWHSVPEDSVLLFLATNTLLGVGLAMDAFSVSCANGLHEPGMSFRRMSAIAGTFGWFQFMMPLAGWFCVHKALEHYVAFAPFIPWIAFGLLLWIGVKMIREGLRGVAQKEHCSVSGGALFVQGVATSIDALSVGFAIADDNFGMALFASLIIGTTTYAICLGGLAIGKRVGTMLSGKASVLGGAILVAIGIEVLVRGL